MRGRPVALTAAQVIALLLIVRCLFRASLFFLTTGWGELSLATFPDGLWFDLAIVVAALQCLLRSTAPVPLGLVAACVPVLAWLLLTVFSPESWRLWHWIAAGLPEGLMGLSAVAFTPPFDRTYRSHMELRGAVLGILIEQVVFSLVLVSLLFGRASRAYFKVGSGVLGGR